MSAPTLSTSPAKRPGAALSTARARRTAPSAASAPAIPGAPNSPGVGQSTAPSQAQRAKRPARQTADVAPSRLVPAVERAVRLLDALARSRRPMSLAQIARELAAPKSSVHGLLSTLVELDLVRRDDASEFALGPRPLQWAGAYSVQSDVSGAFQELASRTGPLASETVMLAVLDGRDVLYLGCRPGTRPLAVNFRVGGRYPASCTSSGKAILATLEPAAVRALFSGERQLPRPTRFSVSSLARLQRQLEQVRTEGYAVDDQEMAEGMQCFGAPVFSAGRTDAVAAVAVSLIKAGTSEAQRSQLIMAIRELAQALSERLGGYRGEPLQPVGR